MTWKPASASPDMYLTQMGTDDWVKSLNNNYFGLQDQFLIPQAAVRIWGTTAHPVRAALAEQADTLAALQPVSDDARSFAGSLSQPYCGVNAGFEASKWLEDASTVTSLALIPLHRDGACFGLLVLGSPDPTRYTADMGVEFLVQVGEVAGASLSRLLG